MLSIALVAHGRFHAFDLGRELARLGHRVQVLSNYPAWAASRFGLDRGQYAGLWAHGGVERILGRAAPAALGWTEAARHRWFGRWAARWLEGEPWDVVHCWSGVSEELLANRRLRIRSRVLMRGSSHIVEQARLLADEQARAGVRIERPSPWMMTREQREYDAADRIVVLSEFARASFIRQGVPAERLTVLPLGVSVGAFRPSADVVAARLARVRAGQPLRVLFVGTLSARKGLIDTIAVARRCQHLRMTFTLVGPAVPESAGLLAGAPANLAVAGRRDQSSLPAAYAEADIFLFPTIEDGFGMVLTQAAAAGLVLLASANCAAPDLLAAGAEGWTVPVRDVDALAERLHWCHDQREALAAMLARAATTRENRTWAEVAEAFAADARTWIGAAGEDR